MVQVVGFRLLEFGTVGLCWKRTIMAHSTNDLFRQTLEMLEYMLTEERKDIHEACIKEALRLVKDIETRVRQATETLAYSFLE